MSRTSPDQTRLYTSGLCDAMAIALHRLTGFPMALWVGELPPEDGEEPWIELCHAAVLIENTAPTWLDVHGIHQGQPPNLVFSEKPTRIWLQEASEYEIRAAFTTEEIDEGTIQTAIAFARTFPTLTTVIKSLLHNHVPAPKQVQSSSTH